ncbi:CPBP family intramembrane glutamic endopeptidase [Lysinibacillus antri]|uniref:CPBP family intramembrane metalloprotease n=1 Tax=Lysinibacillus antri TaxID=2498145 RepID=A0A3S0WHC3_9BACI|nr:CPBP family intramembrane glutamic endopeptidase [Lysinibacillus antri]RUL54657.1 CPBP family intramembrane metalloprotease [Lysinibacillus antri]
MRNFLYQHGLVLFLIVFFGRVVLGMLSVKGIQLINPELSIQEDLGWLVMLIYATCTFLAVKWVKIDKEIGLTKPSSMREYYVWLPTLIIPLTIAYLLGFNSTWGHVPLLLIAAVGVAINEEILFRGILLRALLPFGTVVAIIVPSFLFGAIHLSNIIVGGDVTFALFQFGWTFFAGMALTAMVLANNSLIPAIVYHFILDAVEYAATGEFGVHSTDYSIKWLIILLLLKVAFFIYSLFLLKKSKKSSQQVSLAISSAN